MTQIKRISSVKFLSFLLLLLFIFPSLRNASLCLDYQIDKTVYLKNCENKDKPMLNCDGKCVLAKKLTESSNEKEPQAPSLTKDFPPFELGRELKSIYLPDFVYFGYLIHFWVVLDFVARIEHPPQFS